MKAEVGKILKEFNDAVEEHVRPETYPVAIKMLRERDPVPRKLLQPTKDFGHRVALCQAWTMVRRWGLSLAVMKDDNYCPFAAINFGFSEARKFYLEGRVALGYYAKDLNAGAKLEAGVPRFPYGKYMGLLAAPLSVASFEPDVAAIYGTSFQMMRLVNAYLWNRGGRLENSLTARAACTETVPKTLNTGEPGVVIPCYGEREWGLTESHELIFAAPFRKFEDITEGLNRSYKFGAKRIARFNVSWEAGMFYPYDKLSKMLRIPYKKEILERQRLVKIPQKRGTKTKNL